MTEPTAGSPQKGTDAPAAKAPEKPNPFTAAAKVVKQVQLAAVHFRACSAQLLATQAVQNDASISGISASTSFLRPVVLPAEQGFATRTTLLFVLHGRIGESEEQSPYGNVRATIEATYEWNEDAPTFSEDELKDYALCYGPFHVWGYWREFVQSSLARLDLPQITIPLFLISQATKMVQDDLD